MGGEEPTYVGRYKSRTPVDDDREIITASYAGHGQWRVSGGPNLSHAEFLERYAPEGGREEMYIRHIAELIAEEVDRKERLKAAAEVRAREEVEEEQPEPVVVEEPEAEEAESEEAFPEAEDVDDSPEPDGSEDAEADAAPDVPDQGKSDEEIYNLSKLSVAKASIAIHGIMHRETLELWAAVDKRVGIQKAIEAQLKRLDKE